MNIKSVYIVLGIESKEISLYKQRRGLTTQVGMKKTLSDDGNDPLGEMPKRCFLGMKKLAVGKFFFFFFFFLK